MERIWRNIEKLENRTELHPALVSSYSFSFELRPALVVQIHSEGGRVAVQHCNVLARNRSERACGASTRG